MLEEKQLLKDLYNEYASSTNPCDKPTVKLDGFIKMVVRSGVCDDNFGAREIGTYFNLSKQTQVDEISRNKHLELIFVEFLEAVARVADKSGHAAEMGSLDKSKTATNRSSLITS